MPGVLKEAIQKDIAQLQAKASQIDKESQGDVEIGNSQAEEDSEEGDNNGYGGYGEEENRYGGYGDGGGSQYESEGEYEDEFVGGIEEYQGYEYEGENIEEEGSEYEQ